VRVWAREHAASIALVVATVLVAAQIVAFLVLIPLASQVSEQSQAGLQAKRTQCSRDPVAQKLALAAYAVRRALPPASRITKAELDRYRTTSPKDCPSPKR
jgi:hypothetical protein